MVCKLNKPWYSTCIETTQPRPSELYNLRIIFLVARACSSFLSRWCYDASVRRSRVSWRILRRARGRCVSRRWKGEVFKGQKNTLASHEWASSAPGILPAPRQNQRKAFPLQKPVFDVLMLCVFSRFTRPCYSLQSTNMEDWRMSLPRSGNMPCIV